MAQMTDLVVHVTDLEPVKMLLRRLLELHKPMWNPMDRANAEINGCVLCHSEGWPCMTMQAVLDMAQMREDDTDSRIVGTALMPRPTEEELIAEIAAKLDENKDGVVDYSPENAAYWALSRLSRLGVIPVGATRRPWEPV